MRGNSTKYLRTVKKTCFCVSNRRLNWGRSTAKPGLGESLSMESSAQQSEGTRWLLGEASPSRCGNDRENAKNQDRCALVELRGAYFMGWLIRWHDLDSA